MGAGELRPVKAELLHESERTRVTRLFLPGTSVVRKEPLGPDADRRLQHELAILERLRGVAGVAQLVEAPRFPGSIVMADEGGRSVAGLANPMEPDDLVALAAGLARAVAGMHARGVLHRDITPSHVVLPPGGAPFLVDFGLATPLTEMRPEFTHPTEIVGTLAYLAPEQTGRTARSVDHRADLYALGATLYELATGAPPFGSGDPLRLAHDHLARVAVPPARVKPDVPAALSEIVVHLLEKEPDNRYQTAEGLLHDLLQVRSAARVSIGEHDVPLRLLPPSRLVGRDHEVAVLAAAFDEALTGRCRGVLVAGSAGVGKTALVDQLRSVATGADGWFVAGKFDQYRRDLDFDAVHQAFRALGRLLLAEPEEELAEIRARTLAAAGPNAGLVTATSPEFAALLAVPPDAGDPLTAQARAQRVGVDVLRAIASRDRPVVLFVDDLQWAGRTPLGFVDLVLSEERIDGLLLVGAYRDDDLDAARQMASAVSRWRQQEGLRYVRLDNLTEAGSAAMVAEMLHVDRATAMGLVEEIEPHTSGNPYETVELLNALRGDGVLTATPAGWRWDRAAVRSHLGRSEVAGLPAGRVRALPAPSRQLVEAMACLGGRVELSLLQVATATPASAVESGLGPALDGGLLLAEPGPDDAVRFRHDRIREAVLRGVDPPRRRDLRLAMARRLARVPRRYAVAAEQYLPVVDAIDDPVERRTAAGLLRRAADRAALIGDHALVDALLTAALRLIDPDDTGAQIEVRTVRQTALFGLGRLADAEEEYSTIDALCTTAVQRVDATCVQVLNLTHRKRFAAAIALGVESLRELGIAVPPADRVAGELDTQFDHLYRWLDTAAADDLARPDVTDPTLLAVARLLNVVLPAAYLAPDPPLHAWLSLEAVRVWREHGPCRSLVGAAGIAAFAAVTIRGDYAAGYRASSRFLAASESRGYGGGSSQARFLFSILSWSFEPLESGVRAGRQAREGLVAHGDGTNAGYTYYPVVRALLDCAPSLDDVVAELEAGLAFARRIGNDETAESLGSYRWLAGVLRGESGFDIGTNLIDRHADNPVARLHAHICHATAAALLDDPAALARHSAAAMPLLAADPGTYSITTAHLLRGLALLGETRGAPSAELDELAGWLAARAADAPDNLLHLQRLLEAERFGAAGDFRATVLAFDAARREVARNTRPWHRALIAERAARFHLAHGAEHTGHELLAEARHAYLAWGATAKVGRLDRAYPGLRPAAGLDDLPHRDAVTTGSLDMLAVLSASQALSSETSIDRLHARVVEVLSTMTGATGVHLLVASEDDGWLPAGAERATPSSVLRYARRMREPLVVEDATRDDRFARDPYFAGVACCSVLAVPILSRDVLRAVLLLENRLIRGAFTAERLDGVTLIAGQLAVSLDNAQLYAELTASRARIVATADQTRRRIERDLHDGAQQRLVSLGIRLRAAQAVVPPEAADLSAHLDDLVTETTSALDELRELARGIHPAILAEGGLPPALKGLARRSTVPVELDVRVGRRLPEPVEIAAYYLVSEAVTNAAKHADAATVSVEVHATDSALRVRVRDDGRGGADLARGSGLTGLADRVEALGGRLSVRTAPDEGTTVAADLPLPVVQP